MSTYYFATITTFERFDEEHILHKHLKLQSWHFDFSWCAWRPPLSPRSPPSRASGSWEGCPASSCLLARWDPKDDKDGGESDDDGGGGNEYDKIHTTLPNVFFQGVSVYISTFSMTAIALDRYSTNSFLNFATATMRSMPPNQWYFLFVCRALKSLRIFVELDSDSISTLFLRLGIHFPFPALLISGKLNSWILTRAWHAFQFPMQQYENIKNFKTCIFVKGRVQKIKMEI